ncbi:MAG: NUDIX domain-containing protein, partial [Oscillospiraceae bacterium]|nr:NUDIX domain-containing protein [Oscillospiraceae bacterium]
MKEIWDAYKKDGTLAGIDLVRGEPIPNGLFHIVGCVMVRHVDGSYLLMQRDKDKQNYPGFWELGASGSVLKGETPLQGAERELLEECGITSDGLEL